MGRAPVCHVGINKGAWTREEDEKLVAFIEANNGNYGNWRTLPKRAGLQRCGKSCRLRWKNYLRPDIKRGNFSAEETQAIDYLQAVLGNKWSTIASQLPGRTDNDIKNHWYTHLRKRLRRSCMQGRPATPDYNQLSLNGYNVHSMITNGHSINGLNEAPPGWNMPYPAYNNYSDQYSSDLRQIFMTSQWPQSTTLACSASGPFLVGPSNFMPIVHTPLLFPSPNLVEAHNLQFQTQMSLQESMNDVSYQALTHSLQHQTPDIGPSTDAEAHPNFPQASDLLEYGGNLLFSTFPSLPFNSEP